MKNATNESATAILPIACAVRLSNCNILMAYRDNDKQGVFIIVDEKSEIVKAATVFNSANTNFISTTTLANSNVLIAYSNVGNSNYGTYIILDSAGTVVKAATVFNGAITDYISTTTIANGNVLIAYRNNGNSYYGTYVILDSGGAVVKAATVFNSAITYDISATTLANGNVLIAYRNDGNSSYGTYVILDSSGIVVKAATVFNTATTYDISATTLANGNVLITYQGEEAYCASRYIIVDINGDIIKPATEINTGYSNYTHATNTVIGNDIINIRKIDSKHFIVAEKTVPFNSNTCERSEISNTPAAYTSPASTQRNGKKKIMVMSLEDDTPDPYPYGWIDKESGYSVITCTNIKVYIIEQYLVTMLGLEYSDYITYKNDKAYSTHVVTDIDIDPISIKELDLNNIRKIARGMYNLSNGNLDYTNMILESIKNAPCENVMFFSDGTIDNERLLEIGEIVN